MRSARMSAGAVTSKLGRSATPPSSMPSLVAFSGERTAAVMSAPPRLRSSSTTSWPVWPVAPMTRIFGLDAGAGGGGVSTSSASAMDATDALETSASAARAPEMASRRPLARTSTGSSSEDLATTTIFPVDLRPRASATPRTAERTERDAGRLAMETRAVRRTGATREVDIAGCIVTVASLARVSTVGCYDNRLIRRGFADKADGIKLRRRRHTKQRRARIIPDQRTRLRHVRHVNPRPGRGGPQRQPPAPGAPRTSPGRPDHHHHAALNLFPSRDDVLVPTPSPMPPDADPDPDRPKSRSHDRTSAARIAPRCCTPSPTPSRLTRTPS